MVAKLNLRKEVQMQNQAVSGQRRLSKSHARLPVVRMKAGKPKGRKKTKRR